MPYDLFVAEQDHDALHTNWEFCGTWPKLWLAQVQRDYQGGTRPTLRRWCLFYVRRKTAALGKMHSMGEYPMSETNIGHVGHTG